MFPGSGAASCDAQGRSDVEEASCDAQGRAVAKEASCDAQGPSTLHVRPISEKHPAMRRGLHIARTASGRSFSTLP